MKKASKRDKDGFSSKIDFEAEDEKKTKVCHCPFYLNGDN